MSRETDYEPSERDVRGLLADPAALRVVFQPIVNLRTRRVDGYEALSRFEGPMAVTPDRWFAAARRCGLGPRLEVLAIRAALAVPRPARTFVAVNVSPSTFISLTLDLALPRDLTGVVLELTEHESLGDVERLRRLSASFRARGARVALDDVGAGYADVEDIARVRPDIVKLDRGVIRDLDTVPQQRGRVVSAIETARRASAHVCAEGIETLAELAELVRLGADCGQGYVIARPQAPWAAAAPAALTALSGAATPPLLSVLSVSGQSSRPAARERRPAALPTAQLGAHAGAVRTT